MLEHLIEFEPEVLTESVGFVALEKNTPSTTIDAKVKTTDWLKELGALDDEDIVTEVETQAARKAFATVVSATPEEITHTALAQVKTPAAVQHLVGMLTAYDWEFINQAKELRGYTVAKLVEETNNPSANIRLKALSLLGKVTEIGLFTEKIEVQKTEMSSSDLDQRIKDKLSKFMNLLDVVDVTTVDDELRTVDEPKPTEDTDNA
jgi:hypothetical protein